MKVESLTIAVPAYNEEKSLEDALLSIDSSSRVVLPEYEIIAVDDGSSDHTPEILDSIAAKNARVKAIHHSSNKMIGGAFLSALRQAKSSHIMLIPVDNPLSPSELNSFLSAAVDADIVVGCRPERTGYKLWTSALSSIYRAACSVMFNTRIKDLTWIALYDRKKIEGLSLCFEGIAIFPEILVKAEKRGLKLAQIECPMKARRAGKATISRFSRIGKLFFETLRLWFHINFQKW